MKFISTDKAPAAIGPYSQAVTGSNGKWLFLSGQIAVDPITGQMVQETVDAEVSRVLKNLDAVLTAAGFTRQDVVKVTVYLTDMALFAQANEVYEAFFNGHRPARATVAVTSLPKQARIEIDAIAIKNF